jgi:uncharacterized protein (TIGR03435 family)
MKNSFIFVRAFAAIGPFASPAMTALAQSAAPPPSAASVPTTPAFEVSTVRPSSPEAPGSNLNLGADGIRSSNLPVIFLLKFALDLNGGSDDQIIGAPSWISSRPFDIRAKVDEEDEARIATTPTDQRIAITRKMVQALLADRFQLKVHHESRELPVLALTIAKGGSKLTAVNDTPQASTTAGSNWTGLHNVGAGETEGRDVPVALLVNALSSKSEVGGRLVVDETGLTGKYNFKLTWAPEDRQTTVDDHGADRPSLFTAIREQLGLELETKKAPVDCVVIDHVELPTPN